MVGTEFIVSIVTAVLLALVGLVIFQWIENASPCFGDHELSEYLTTGDYRIVGEPALQILPGHQCEVELLYKYFAECQRLGCDHTETKWQTVRTDAILVESLEDITSVIIEEES